MCLGVVIINSEQWSLTENWNGLFQLFLSTSKPVQQFIISENMYYKMLVNHLIVAHQIMSWL